MPAVWRRGGIGPRPNRTEARCGRGRKERVGRSSASSVAEDRPVVAELLPKLADPARRETKSPRHVGGPLAEHQPADQPPVAAAMRAGPGREIAAKLDLVGHRRPGVVGQRLGQRVGGLGRKVGQLADAEAVPLLGPLAQDIAGLELAADPTAAANGAWRRSWPASRETAWRPCLARPVV